LPEELAEVQKFARDFADKEIAPAAAQDDRKHAFRKDLVVKWASWDLMEKNRNVLQSVKIR
jgi:hypothetical protein